MATRTPPNPHRVTPSDPPEVQSGHSVHSTGAMLSSATTTAVDTHSRPATPSTNQAHHCKDSQAGTSLLHPHGTCAATTAHRASPPPTTHRTLAQPPGSARTTLKSDPLFLRTANGLGASCRKQPPDCTHKPTTYVRSGCTPTGFGFRLIQESTHHRRAAQHFTLVAPRNPITGHPQSGTRTACLHTSA